MIEDEILFDVFEIPAGNQLFEDALGRQNLVFLDLRKVGLIRTIELLVDNDVRLRRSFRTPFNELGRIGAGVPDLDHHLTRPVHLDLPGKAVLSHDIQHFRTR
ncbi:MAG: hypothetical protein AAFQ17_04205, partial [Pseudomonadota bacterium]